ncbi:hypothetical protein MGYG_00399 [Nannizzia gypsea CBS 118893]|uniref:BZIP domain-containing protein n=1 Tax=Arthroderma gypseum (strain ATCC MYA-4604 / CBS 118893) TaxID=535722 RepID=E5QZJ4_ARTGP|nr:hypothetical protein MGYG_00399 [Nannizzia gypsea CBS 118893]EFQ97360.1 hypothetical protein MGYG_00399 [Nannizzia gypsea CBS 118893]
MASGQEKSSERALRVRENKRRHRLRQREYVADLERRLAEAREQGIQASKEVQAAARRVAWENSRLRQILRDRGLGDNAINALVYDTDKSKPTEQGSRPEVVVQPKASLCISHSDQTTPLGISLANQGHVGLTPDLRQISAKEPSVLLESNKCASGGACAMPSSTDCPGVSHSQPTSCANEPPSECAPTATLPPCRLLTILANNPNTDVHQIPPVSNKQSDDDHTGGVECSQAREMLMRFATSEEKIDQIAEALEKGCVKDSKSGGCRVKNNAMWEALERVWE